MVETFLVYYIFTVLSPSVPVIDLEAYSASRSSCHSTCVILDKDIMQDERNHSPDTEKQDPNHEAQQEQIDPPAAKSPSALIVTFHRFSTTPFPPSLASTHFFNIPELVEKILFHLPVLQLLPLQRINSTFEYCIKSSTFFQRKLFFKVDPCQNNIDHPETNPFMLKLGHGFNSMPRHFGYVEIEHLRNDAHVTPSWRNMLVSMPPAKGLVIARVDTDWGQAARRTVRGIGSELRMHHVAEHAWENEDDLSSQVHMELFM